MHKRPQACVGRLVISRAGHDCGSAAIITELGEGDYVFIADGWHRPLERPKKKKLKHLHLTPFIVEEAEDALLNGRALANGELRNMIRRIGRQL